MLMPCDKIRHQRFWKTYSSCSGSSQQQPIVGQKVWWMKVCVALTQIPVARKENGEKSRRVWELVLLKVQASPLPLHSVSFSFSSSSSFLFWFSSSAISLGERMAEVGTSSSTTTKTGGLDSELSCVRTTYVLASVSPWNCVRLHLLKKAEMRDHTRVVETFVTSVETLSNQTHKISCV